MLIKIEGVWINPRHVIRVNGEQEPAVIIMSDGVAIQSMKPADELAAIFNSEDPTRAQFLADIAARQLRRFAYLNERARIEAHNQATDFAEEKRREGLTVQVRHLPNAPAYVVELLD